MTNANMEFEYVVTEETNNSPERVICGMIDYSLTEFFINNVGIIADRLIADPKEIVTLTGKQVNLGDVACISEDGKWTIFRIHTIE